MRTVDSSGRRRIAHELSNLLTLVLSYAELAGEQVSDRPGAVRDLARVHDAAIRAGLLVRDLAAAEGPEVPLRGAGARTPLRAPRRARAR